MRALVYSTRAFDKRALEEANGDRHKLGFVEASLRETTALLAEGYEAVVIFSQDEAPAAVLERLKVAGVRLVALRAAGFNQVDLEIAQRLGIAVARVPAYSPHAVAEHAVALMLCLNRKIHRAYNRVRERNFALEGLMGFDMHGKTAGVVGAGRIGLAACSILRGFGCRVLAFDPKPSEEARTLGVEFVGLDTLLRESDIVSLHCPLTPGTRHLIDGRALASMKDGAMLINTSRGGVVDTKAVIDALKARRLGSLGIDVYEEEGDLFFKDLSGEILDDEVFARLLTFPNVLITGHQGFFTREALGNIARTTIKNLTDFEAGGLDPENTVTMAMLA
ncbi:MAG: 2-hydroxyacid dehydrogenase [Phycisphaera sp.]|nr:MAG: 2-hydroxyacid dehydrogenase [Phycisphaera sp.]